MNNDIAIISVASNDYLDRLERLLASARIYLPNSIFITVLINVDDLKDGYLKKLFPNLRIIHKYVRFNSIDEKRGYCANYRAKLFPIIMEEYDCPIVWIDADSLFIKPASDLIEYAKQYDASVEYSLKHPTLKSSARKLKKHPKGPLGTPYYGVVSTGVITTNNSKIAKRVFKEYRKMIAPYDLKWFADQEAFFLTIKEFELQIKFKPLEQRYCSRVNDSHSIIWTIKGGGQDAKEYKLIGDQFIQEIAGWPMESVSNPTDENEYQDLNKPNHILSMIFARMKRVLKHLIRQ